MDPLQTKTTAHVGRPSALHLLPVFIALLTTIDAMAPVKLVLLLIHTSSCMDPQIHPNYMVANGQFLVKIGVVKQMEKELRMVHTHCHNHFVILQHS